jgi:hypothetical protein
MDFQAEVTAIRHYFNSKLDYIDEEAYAKAKYKMYEDVSTLTDADIAEIILKGSHNGSVLRTEYYKLVYKYGMSPKAFWDAAIMTFLFGAIWDENVASILKDKRAKALLKRIRHPKWVEYGLKGGNWSSIKRDSDAFCAYMDELNEKEAE